MTDSGLLDTSVGTVGGELGAEARPVPLAFVAVTENV